MVRNAPHLVEQAIQIEDTVGIMPKSSKMRGANGVRE